MAYNESKTRTWSRTTLNDGLYLEAEYNRLYDNFIAVAGNSGSVPDRTIQELHDDLSTVEDGGLHKNYIINGAMEIAQRGTSFVAASSGTYPVDRFLYSLTGSSAVHTLTQDTDVPASENFKYSLKIDCTTADTSIAAGDRVLILYRMEGYDFSRLVGKTATLSFWVKGAKTGVHCVAFRNTGTSDRSYIVEYTINAANTWEYKTITITFDYSGGTWNYTTGSGCVLSWALAVGTDQQSTADTWLSGNYAATANQVNELDNTANNFYLTGIMFNEGSQALPFRRAGSTFAGELALCKRYYENSYLFGVTPGSAASAGEHLGSALNTYSLYSEIIRFEVEKRVAPVITYYSSNTGTSGKWYDYTGAADLSTTINGSNISTKTFSSIQNNSLTGGRRYGFFWAAEAEI